jgi:hypothetical protein
MSRDGVTDVLSLTNYEMNLGIGSNFDSCIITYLARQMTTITNSGYIMLLAILLTSKFASRFMGRAGAGQSCFEGGVGWGQSKWPFLCDTC